MQLNAIELNKNLHTACILRENINHKLQTCEVE